VRPPLHETKLDPARIYLLLCFVFYVFFISLMMSVGGGGGCGSMRFEHFSAHEFFILFFPPFGYTGNFREQSFESDSVHHDIRE
jgi:hypothetical protein